MRGHDLPGFLAGGWSPYELTWVRLPETPDAQRLDEIGRASCRERVCHNV